MNSDSIDQKIKDLIAAALQTLGLPDTVITLEHPTEFSHGDFSTNVAMASAKALGKNPRELADLIKQELSKNLPPEISKIEVAGAGFINFYLSKDFFAGSINEILSKKENFGKSENGTGKKVLVEYSSPNIAKPFTVGHLRSTIIGDAIANLFSSSGYEVVRDNHLGDWGTQFGKLIVAIKRWGDLEEIKKSDAPVKALVDLYIRFHDEAEKNPELENEAREWFSKIEHGDTEARSIWWECVLLSMIEFDKIYKRLNVTDFDTAYGESFYEDKMAKVLEDVKLKKIGQESEGAYLIFFPDETKLPPLMLTKSDGSSLYALRDLATDRFRKEKYGPDIKIINEVGAEQSLYFRQIFEAEKILGYFEENQRVHIGHGLYRFAEGKMSTRKGNVIWLDDILNEAEVRAGEINKDTAKEVALAAIKFNDLKRDCAKDIVFDWDEMLNIQGDSGPYIQYTHARALSIIEKSKNSGVFFLEAQPPKDWQTTEVEKMLYRFPEIVERSCEEYAPHHIAIYLIELARAFNSFYGAGVILDNSPYSPYKVAITSATAVTLKNGLQILGIPVPEKM